MNRLSSHRIVRECSEYRCKGFRRVSGVNLVLEDAFLRMAHGAGSESRRRSGGELEQMSEANTRASRAAHPRRWPQGVALESRSAAVGSSIVALHRSAVVAGDRVTG